MTPNRVIAYIDCFNLYHARLANKPLRWLNLVKLVEHHLAPGQELLRVKAFTANAQPLPWDKQRSQRQQTYHEALLSNPKLDLILGTFRVDRHVHWIWDSYERALSNWSSGIKPESIAVARTEEQGSDVNLGSHLLRDTYQSHLDTAIVITNDSDLITPIRFAVESGIRVIVIHPEKNRSHHSRGLKQAATASLELRSTLIERSLFPDTIHLPSGKTIQKPHGW